jgi:hypothetical protein
MEEIAGEITYFRNALQWMHDSPRELTESIMKINRQLQLPTAARTPILEVGSSHALQNNMTLIGED